MDTPFTQDDLDSWVKTQRNVLFEGYHGSGKTARVLGTFAKFGLKFKYFSCATLDPWTDIIGIPTIVNEGGVDVIHYIKPREFAFDEVECIFLDEFNRGKDKVQNACMELLQFKSINGKKFNNLRFIWAAINPEPKDESDQIKYTVEKLDPATKDRFQIHIRVPYVADQDYFAAKFNPKLAKSVIEWWNGLSPEIQLKVSPRRLEYAVDAYNLGLNVKHVLPFECNVTTFLTHVQGGTLSDVIKGLFARKDATETKQYIDNSKNLLNIVNGIIDNMEYVKYFAPFLPKENLAAKINESDNVFEYLIRNYSEYSILIKESVEQRKDLCDKLANYDINKLMIDFDFSKLTLQVTNVKYPSKLAPVTTNIVKTIKNDAFKPELKDANNIIKELIFLDSTNDNILNELNCLKWYDYIQFVVENASRLTIPPGFVVLTYRTLHHCIDAGNSEIISDINSSSDRFKAFILKNLFTFL